MKTKKAISLLLTLVMLLSLFPVQYAAAANEAEPALSIESKSATPGSTVTVKVSIRNNPGVAAVTLRLEFGDLLTLTKAESGDAFSALTFTKLVDMSPPCILSWDADEVRAEDIKDGQILSLTFKVSEDAPLDTKLPVSISCDEAVDNNMHTVDITTGTGEISVLDFMYGDVNGDFEVGAVDMTLIRRYIADGYMNNNPSGYNVNINERAADVYLNGSINGSDVTVIRRHKGGWEGYETLPYIPELPPHTHQTTYVAERPATKDAEGVAAHYRCDCGKLFRDANATEEVDYSELVIPFVAQGMTAIRYNLYSGDGYLESIGVDNPNPDSFVSTEGLSLVPLTAPAGYEFKGWRLVDGTDEGTPVTKLPPQQPGTTVEVRAVFNPIEYNITYVNYKTPVGEVIDPKALHYYVNEGKPNLPNPEVKNYIFLGWYDKDGNEVESIPAGTTGNMVLNGYWTSLRNLARPKKLEDPIILNNTKDGVIYFAYELGTIENIPVSDALWSVQNVAGISQEISYTTAETITESQAENISEAISKATVDSGTWTLSENWNNVTQVNETWAEQNGMTREEAETKTKSKTNTYSHTDDKGGNESTSTTDGTTALSYDSREATNGSSVELDVSAGATLKGKVNLGPIAKGGYEITGNIERDTKDYEEMKTHTGTDTTKIDTTIKDTTTSWNASTTKGRTKTASESSTVKQALSQIISSTKGYGQSYTQGGQSGSTQGFSSTDSKNVSTSSTLTYSKAKSSQTTKTYKVDGNLEGNYRLVMAGTAHVFGVVGYDVASRSYFTYTYSVMDDKTHEFLDYTPKGSNFDDAENGVLPFEVPYFVFEYVTEATAMTEGLQYRTNSRTGTATISGYTGTSTDITIPAYISAGNTAYKVTEITASAFAGKPIRAIALGKYIDEIPARAFENCTGLEQVSGCFTKIGAEAFSGCTSLENFGVSERVTAIGSNAFSGVPRITVKAISVDAAFAAAKAQMPDATEENQRQTAKELTRQLVSSAVQSGAQQVILDLSRIMDGAELTLHVPAISRFELVGGKRTYTNFALTSDAGETVLREIFIENYSTIPLRINSEQLTLEVVAVDSSGFAMSVGADQPTITLRRDSVLTSQNGKALVFKDPDIIAAVVDGAVGVLETSGNIYVYGDIKGQDNLDVHDGQIIRLTQGGEQFTSGAFTVNFNANGGTVSPQTQAVQFCKAYGSLPVPTRANNEFDGWYTEASGGKLITSESTFEELNDITLYAHWTLNTFKLYLNANGGSVNTDSLEVTYGAKIGALPVPTKAYNNFDGWYTEPTGGTRYTEDTEFRNVGSITLYAHWSLKPTSGWVLASSLPTNAQTVDEKWTYDQRTNTESRNTSMPGYTQYGSYWVKSGSGSATYASFPGGFDGNDSIYKSFMKSPYTASETSTSKREVSNTWAGYVYWHWMYDCGKSSATNRIINDTNGYGESYKMYYSYFGAFTSTKGDYEYDDNPVNGGGRIYKILDRTSFADTQGSYWWYRFDYYTSTYTDYYKMFQYYKLESKESTTTVTASDLISNVQHWVRYREK